MIFYQKILKICIQILFIFNFVYLFNCQKVWPNGIIPFTVDKSISKDLKQFYALLTAKSILEQKTCLRFMPRNSESSFIQFTDLGDYSPCWDIFDSNTGVVPVNVGRACLKPFTNKKQHVFSDCDLQFVNNIYNCDEKYELNENEYCPSNKLTNFHKYKKSSTMYKRTSMKKNPWNKFYQTSTALPILTEYNVRQKSTIYTNKISKIANTSGKKRVDEISPRIGNCSSACQYDGILTPLFQSYNGNFLIMNHFYTEDKIEQVQMTSSNYLINQTLGFIGETPTDRSCNCLKPIYRLYSNIDHDTLLTTDIAERDRATSILGYNFERIIGYCTSDPGCGAYLPLYRLFNFVMKDHLYTTDQEIMQYYRQNPSRGYNLEKVECFIWQYNISVAGCYNT